MAEKEASLYDKHKKYHDLVGRLQDVSDDKHTTGLASHIHQLASEYLHENKGEDGKVQWKDDKDHKQFTDKLWDAAADRIAKDYLKLSDKEIEELKGKKTKDGESMWENMIASYIGNMDKDAFFERVKHEGELNIQNILSTYVNTIAQRHTQYRHTAIVRKEIKEPEDMDGVAAYLKDAKKHNKESLKPMKVPSKFKSLDDAMGAVMTASNYMPRNYHPDKKETYH